MNNDIKDSQAEQALTGKQQLFVKAQLAQRNNSLVAKQQLHIKAGLAKLRSESVNAG